MVKKIKYNDDEAKILSLELQKELLKYKTSLNKLETNLGLLQAGDKNGLFWNGSNAYDVNKALIGHFDHDKVLLNKLENCSKYLESIVK